jgi:hypothetical protein
MPDSAVSRGAEAAEVLPLPPLVLDLSVLLSPWGVWLAQRLSRLTEVWLPRSLVMLLEGDGLPLDAGVAAELAPLIALWNGCWSDFVQRKSVFWFSDTLDMSHAPKGEPAALLDRLDVLIAALDRKAPAYPIAEESERERLLIEGARDALALAATLRGEPAAVLSALRHGEAEPWVCRALDRFGLASHRLSDEALHEILAGRLLRGFAYAGIAPVLGSRALRLAALHLAVTGSALPLPSPRPTIGAAIKGEPGEDALASLFEETQDDTLWDDAVAIWYDVS